jgi:hypothetical protein
LIDNKYLPLVSIAMAAVFVLVPAYIYQDLILISTIGLGAAGVYQMTKKSGEPK